MIPLLLFLFPIAELVFLAWTAGRLGFLKTLALLAGSALLGFAVLLLQGRSVWKQRNSAGQYIVKPQLLVRQACISAAGFLLIIPGFLTDFLAIGLLTPGLRQLLLQGGLRLLGRNVQVRIFGTSSEAFFSDLRRRESIDVESRDPTEN